MLAGLAECTHPNEGQIKAFEKLGSHLPTIDNYVKNAVSGFDHDSLCASSQS